VATAVIVWAICAAIAWAIGTQKGRRRDGLIFGLLLGLIGTSQAAVAMTGSTSAGAAAFTTSHVPTSIDAGGVTDVTHALDAYLAAVNSNTTVVFPVNGRYRIEGTLLIRGKDSVTIDGNNSTFFAMTSGLAGPPPPNCHGNGPCHPNRSRMQWDFESDTNLYVHDINVIGASTNPGTAGTHQLAYEAQHAFNIGSGNNVVLDHVTAKNTWGDLVNIGGGISNRAATNVTVSNSTLDGASGQCVAIVDASHVLIEHNSIGLHAGCKRSLFDFEANVPSNVITYITIEGNQLGQSRFSTVADAGSSATEHDITIDNNHMRREPLVILVKGYPTARRSNYRITNNVGVNGHNQGSMSFTYVDGVVISGNTQPFRADNWPRISWLGAQAPVWLNCSTNISVTGNDFTPRPIGMPQYVSHHVKC